MKNMDDRDYADILVIESLIKPEKKTIMSTLGIKLRNSEDKQNTIECKACLLKRKKLNENIHHDISKTKLLELNKLEKILKNYTINAKMGEIVFAINSNEIQEQSTRTIDSLYSLCNKDLKENMTPTNNILIDNKPLNIGIHPINSINLGSLERHIRENVLEVEEATPNKENANDTYISSSLSSKVKNIEKTKLQVKIHEIKDPVDYGKHYSMNSITGETMPYENLKKETTDKENINKYEVPLAISGFETTQELYEIETCLRISDLRKSQLYGKLEERGENGRFQRAYFKIEKYTLICYNKDKIKKGNIQDKQDLCIPTNPNYFYKKKYALNLLNLKIFLVINKKIEGVMKGLKSIFFKQKKDFIDLSNRLIKNVIDVRKDVYKVIVADNEKETSFILPILEFSIESEGHYYFYRTDNSSTFLRWLFTLLSRSGNPKYLH